MHEKIMKKTLITLFITIIFYITPSYSAKMTPSCQSTKYTTPCTCEYSGTSLEVTMCNLKKKREASKKMTRSEASKLCATKAEEYTSALAAEIYKDCMKDKGFR